MWKWTCPMCGKEIYEELSLKVVKEYIGATHDCPECGGLVMIEEDLTCTNFAKELSCRYAEMGLIVSPEEAVGNYIELTEPVIRLEYPENKETGN